jgi:outer membrane receptor protein involved in Fe transport
LYFALQTITKNIIMRKACPCLAVLLMTCLLSLTSYAQNITLSGNVRSSSNKEGVPAVSVTIKGSAAGTFTDEKGAFKLVTSQKFPITLIFTSVGFETKEISVSAVSASIEVDLAPASSLGTEVVVSASRVPERILESPVSIERVSVANIRNTPATSYYDIIRTLKGVDVTTASLTFNSVTTRGFNGSGNTRFNQFVDGMDNQAPGLNFSVGSVIGLTELDVDNMELLPGASSALYGSGGMNGTLLINSKNPFKYQGFSAQIKQGIMHVGSGAKDPIAPSPFYDWSFRWGKKVSDKFAFKLGAQFVQAKDWVANDQTNYTGAGTGSANHTLYGDRVSDPNYDGVNVYGDETSANMFDVAGSVQSQTRAGILAATGNALDIVALMNASLPANATPAQIGAFIGSLPAPLQSSVTNMVPFYFGLRNNIIPKQKVSRTGYKENEVINNNTVNFKFSGGLYYKITPGIEASLTGNYGTGNTVYTGSDRYSLKNLKVGQYKLEFKAANWFLRAYTTQENSGDAYNATITTRLFNEAWKPSTTWFPQYTAAYVQSISAGLDPYTAFGNARNFADVGRPVAGTSQFQSLYDQVRSKPIPVGGGFLDRTNLYQVEGQYNLSSAVKFAEVIVGGSWRQYVLNSQGTLFADSTGPIHTNEIGAYLQVAKKIFNDKLKLTASIRYDKNDNFKGKFTPRFSAVLAVAKDHNVRASYQNAYRFPSNQNQWINLNTGAGILIGGLPSLRTFYHFDTNPVYTAASLAIGVPVVQTFGEYKPESVNSFELGYKGLFGKRVLVDIYGYYSKYKDFIGRISVGQFFVAGNPASGVKGFSVSVNSANTVTTYGEGFSIDYMMRKNFAITLNASSDNIDNPDPNFATYFNTPKYRINVGLSNSGFGFEKRVGFNFQFRWQDTFFTEADFKQGEVEAFGTFDGQISYKLTPVRSVIKIGATNMLNRYYRTSFGNPSIGGLYYISFGYNVF